MEGFLYRVLIFSIEAFLFAFFFGRKRKIGFGWSFFLTLFSPLFGWIAAITSKKKEDIESQPSKSNKIWGWILICITILSSINFFANLNSSQLTISDIDQFIFQFGLLLIGIYLIQIGAGKNFNPIIKEE